MIPRRRVGESRPFRRRVLRAGRVHGRRERGRFSLPHGAPGSGSSCTPTSCARQAAPSSPRSSAPTSADHLAAISDDGNRALARARPPSPRCFPGRCCSSGRTEAGAGARADRRGRRSRAGDGLQSRHVADAELPADPDARRQPAADVGRRSVRRRDRQRRGRARLADRSGQIAPGFSADLALFEIDDVRELPYWYGDQRCVALMGTRPCLSPHTVDLH